MATTTAPLDATRNFDFGDPTPNAVGRAALVSHENCVVTLDEKSAPRLLWHGEDLMRAKMPAGTRVIYPKPQIPGLRDRRAAIEYAIDHPEGADPLDDQLRPGMKVSIAIDDISLPLPKMKRPDLRQQMLEVLLERLAAKSIDDIHIIVATSFHRRMEEFEIRHAVGDKIYDAYSPDQLYNHDAEEPDGIVELGQTEIGEHVRINRRCAESDLIIYCNINLVPMDGGAKSIAIGLCDYLALKAHHNPKTIRESDSYFDHTRSKLTFSANRQAAIIKEHLNVFHIETVVNNAMFGKPTQFFYKNTDDYSPIDSATSFIARNALSALPRKTKRKILFSVPAEYELIAVHAGETHACHEKTLAYCYQQYCVPVQGQSDVMIAGIPFISPYNVNSILNPLLVQVMALGYFFNMYRNKPLAKKDGVLILTHPVYDDFDERHHPSYIEFFRRILPETTDAMVLQHKYEEEFAHDPQYIEQYRKGHAYHGVHPFYMWYWGENGRQHFGKVIAVNVENERAAKIMGWDTANTVDEALELAQSHLGHKPSISLFHDAPINMVDVTT